MSHATIDPSTAEPWRPADNLANRVKLVRITLKLTQEQFAALCGLTMGELQGIEDGRAVRDEIRKTRAIARATDADEEWLRDGGPLADSEHFQRPVTRRPEKIQDRPSDYSVDVLSVVRSPLPDAA